MNKETKTFYEFDDFRVEPQERRLLRGEQQVEVTPKTFDMLLMFVRSGGRLLTKEELMAGLWPDSYVDEANLKVNIATLRKMLHQCQNGNPKNNNQFIETIPKTGYRFLRAVRVFDESGASQNPLVASPEDRAERAAADPVVSPESQAPAQPGSSRPRAFQRAMGQYRAWILALAAISAAGSFVDAVVLHAHGGHLLRDIFGAVIAAIGIYCYLWSAKKNQGIQPASTQVTAFRGLVPFEATDAKRFYGRDIETTAIVEMVTHSEFQFGVLYGESGCGKTSLIRAGLIHRLESSGYMSVHCRFYKDPLESVITSCRIQTRLAPGKNEAPAEYLCRVAQKSVVGLVIICDQFEEFYVNFAGRQERAPFFRFLHQCSQSVFIVPVKFLFTVRSDFLHFIISAFDEHLPDALVASRRYHLQEFDENQAVEVIERSVQRAQWLFEPSLVRQVARDLAVNGMVLPSELQIVGEQLQSKRIFTLDQYRRAGGKEQLVHGYLQDVIKLTGEMETAQLILRSLISDEDTRLTLSLAEIHQRVQRSERAIGRILKLFAQMRLIREIQEEDGARYELMHEYLIEKINQATGRIMDATQRANRYFRQYLSNYMVDKRTRIPVARLWFIYRHSDLARDEQQRRLLRKSLWQGLLRAGILAIFLAALVVGMAAWLSITEDWEEVLLNDGHTAGVHRAVFSPDGRLLVSCGEDGKTIVWDFARRLKLATLAGHAGWVNALVFSPDGKWFATGGYDHRVIIWNAVTFKKERMLPDAGGRIGSLAISPNGKLLAVATDISGTILWDDNTWQELFVIPKGGLYGATFFSADSKNLFVAGTGWWNLATHRETGKTRAPSMWAAVSHDHPFMVSIDSNGLVFFEDLIAGRLLSSIKAHQDNGRAVAYSPDGRLVATGADNIVLWDANSRHKIVRLTYPSIIWALAFSPDGRWLISTHGDGSILVWDPAEHELIANLNGHSGPVRTVAYSPDGKHIASAGEDDSIIIWDAQSKQKQDVLIEHKDKVNGIKFAPDSRSLVSVDFSRVLIYWQLDSNGGHKKWELQVKNPNISTNSVAISPDGRWVATPYAVYSAQDGTQVALLNFGSPWTMAFSPDSHWLVFEEGESLVVWDSRSWRKASYSLATSSLMGVNFSLDGKLLATGDNLGPVRLWQVDSFRELATLGSHTNRVKSVVFSPDGKQIASAGDDHVINLWDVRNRKKISTIGIHSSPVLSLAFSPDGKHLVSGEHDNSVRLYTRHRSLWGHTLD